MVNLRRPQGLRTGLAAAALAAAPLAALGAHPLQTEDTATQGQRNVEIETGWSRSRSAGVRVNQLQPQLSYGITPAVDVLLQPAWLTSNGADGTRSSGLGDTHLDAKWRWFGAAPLSLAVRGGVAFATGRQGLGLPHGTAAPHAVLVATVDAVPFTLHGNLGWARLPGAAGGRRNLGRASGALLWAASDSLTLTAELSGGSNPDPARSAWTKGALAGLVYTIRPGLDVDAGYQTTLRSSPAARTWLLGLTYRFALLD